MSRRSSRFYRVTAFAIGSAVAGAIIGAAPVQQPSLPDPVPVVQVQDVALTSFDFDSFVTLFVTSLEKAAVYVLRDLSRLFGLNDLTTSAFLDKFLLGWLTPNELLSFTGLGHVTLGHLAGFFGLGHNPVSALLAVTGLSDGTTLPQAAQSLGLTDLPLSNLYNLIGMPDYQDDTLSDLANALGAGGGPVSNLFGLLGLTGGSTLADIVNALGIGHTNLDTLLGDWGVADDHINGFLAQLGVSPQELFQIFGITDPSSLPGGIWNGTAFTPGTTVEEFANAAGLGQGDVDQLLTAGAPGGISDASLNDALTGIGLQPDATVDQVLNTTGFNSLSISDFLDGLGVYGDSDNYDSATVGDLLTYIPGFQHGTIGDLLAALGLSDHSTLNDLLTAVPGFDGTTLSELVTNLGWGDEHLSNLASNLLGDTTVDQYLTDILHAL